jgi:regulator of protease activity HflC (stomatin/prohibitin superfamily)
VIDSALGWIGQLADFFGTFFPRWVIVPTTHGAIKWVRGSKVVALGPGIHWYWPVTTQFAQHPIVRQATDLRSQTLITKDNQVLAVGAIVVYEISDVEKLVAHTYDPDQTIRDIAMGVIHDVLCGKTWEEIRSEQRGGSLDREFRREIKKQLDDYGVRMLRVTLSDLSPARVYRLIQSQGSDGV